MIPDYWCSLISLPTDVNGKVKRSNLPEALPITNTKKEAIENDVQQQISDIWQQVLQHNNFGIKDNFFDVGGQSIQATRLQKILKEAFQKPIELMLLFKYTTIAQQSKLITDGEDIQKARRGSHAGNKRMAAKKRQRRVKI